MKKLKFHFLKKAKDKISSSADKAKSLLKNSQGIPRPPHRYFSRENISQLFSKIDFDKIFHQVFSPHSRPSIHQGFLVLLIASSAYLAGRMLALSLQPSATKNTSSPTLQTMTVASSPSLHEQIRLIKGSDLFKAQGDKKSSPPDCQATPKAPGCSNQSKVDPNLACHDANKKSSLPITLLATIVLQDEVKSVASVQVRGEKALLNLRKGEEIPRLAKITGIHSTKLIIKNKKNGHCEFVVTKKQQLPRGQIGTIKVERNPVKGKKLLEKSKDTGIKVSEGNKFKIKKSLRDEMLGNISEVLTQARAIQIKNPDGTIAFRMQEIIPGSIYSKLNIENGDIIKGINGKNFTNMNEIMSLFGQLRERDHYEINILRNGAEQTFEYDFE